MTSPVELALSALFNPAITTPGALFLAKPIPIGSLILFGAMLGRLARPAAFLAALIVWFCFCLSLYWISWDRIADCLPGNKHCVRMRWFASAALLVIMACQQVSLGLNTAALVGGSRVESSADLPRLIHSRPELAKATTVAEPEYLAEALPYYINPIYLTREHKFRTCAPRPGLQW
ncbi:hypothetical protein [Rhizobium laguerreae]|uniref:hypothetical protein n=1 Tax=Rhizobium laguerreae TaxID=1076926 RepID=UPI0021B0F3B7|nr:hypothetical protein [Rhizobium laguerreae]